jgi:hypothetical protein
VDGMTRKMKDQIQCRRKSHPGQTDAEKWEAIYKILFPNEVVPDPCKLNLLFPRRFSDPLFESMHYRLGTCYLLAQDFEPVPDHDVQGQRLQSPDSVNLSEYEAYLRRVLPHFVRNVIKEAVSGELEPIEAQLQSRMMKIVQEATSQAFLSFRNMRRSDSQARSTPGIDTAITTTSSTNQYTSTETFFQPPPPVIYPVSFSGNELYLAQQKSRNNSPSDSGYASHPSLSNSSNYASSDKIERDVAFSTGVGEEQPQSCPKNALTFDILQLWDPNEVIGGEAFSGMDLLENIYQPENSPTTSSSVPAPPPINTSMPNQQINNNLFLGDLWFETTEPGEMLSERENG